MFACVRYCVYWKKCLHNKKILAFSCPMIPFLYHYKKKWPNTNRIKIAGWNCIFPLLGIWWKTIESKSHLDQKFMNFNVKSPNVCHFCFKLIVLHDTLSVIWSFYLEMIQERCHLKAKTLIFINMKNNKYVHPILSAQEQSKDGLPFLYTLYKDANCTESSWTKSASFLDRC